MTAHAREKDAPVCLPIRPEPEDSFDLDFPFLGYIITVKTDRYRPEDAATVLAAKPTLFRLDERGSPSVFRIFKRHRPDLCLFASEPGRAHERRPFR